MTALVYLFYGNYHPNIHLMENVPEYEEDYPHNHLYDRNLTPVNLTNFKFLINSDICNVRRVSLVTIIHSASQNTEARAMIRWALFISLFILLKVSSEGMKTTS